MSTQQKSLKIVFTIFLVREFDQDKIIILAMHPLNKNLKCIYFTGYLSLTYFKINLN